MQNLKASSDQENALQGPVQSDIVRFFVKKPSFLMTTAEHRAKRGALMSTRPCVAAQVPYTLSQLCVETTW